MSTLNLIDNTAYPLKNYAWTDGWLSNQLLEKNNHHVSDADHIANAFLPKVEQMITMNLDNRNLVEVICKSLHMNYVQFHRIIKVLTGKTPAQFIRKIRLREARLMLQSTQLNVSEVAKAVGFNDPNYFSRAFQKEYRVNPGKCRNCR